MLLETFKQRDPTGLVDHVDEASYLRGVIYAHEGAVTRISWDRAAGTLLGQVRGSGRKTYSVIAHLDEAVGGGYEFGYGMCNCPVGSNCKHVVALVLTAAGNGKGDQLAVAEAASPEPTWEHSLEAMLDGSDGGDAARGLTPLGLELTLSTSPSAARARSGAGPVGWPLMARLVRPGKNGGWVAGGLNWSKLGQLHYSREYVAEQARLLQELYALYQAGRSNSYYAYGYGRDEKHIDLSRFDSRQLWPMLDEAESIGLRMVHGRRTLGEVESPGMARMCVDVTDGDRSGMLAAEPVLRIDGVDADVVPVSFIGVQAHGVVYTDRAAVEAEMPTSDWRLGLARLGKPIPQQLQQMAVDGQRLEIPETEAPRFRDEYVPRLRRVAAVESSDGSFTPPVVSGPTLVAHAAYDDEHVLDLTWEWLYEVGELEKRVPVTPEGVAGLGFRDVEAEQTVLQRIDAGLEPLGIVTSSGIRSVAGAFIAGADGPSLVPHTRLSGMDTMRFTTEVLPLLEDAEDVVVDISGEPADYREATDSLTVGVSTEAVADNADWFDLGVTISVEGREVPFVNVFTALARDEQHMLLPDGAFFSLQKPELQALRRLIEEARALGEGLNGQTRISRFQAGLWEELAALGVVTHQAEAWQQQVEGLLSIDAVEQAEPPASLVAELRPYQLDGFRWLAFLWEHRLGGILADDMGLGKTLQTLALICHAKVADPECGPFLVVAPTSVVSNWVAEAARFAPGLRVVPVTDTLRRRGESIEEVTAGADVVVTTYTLLRLDSDDYGQVSWAGVVLDEAQYVKNHQSKTYQAVRQLPSPFKLAITGTPMENNLMELWSQLSITAPGMFPSPTKFDEYYARRIEKQGDAGLLAQLRRRIRPLVKRRTKEQVATDLPAKQEQVIEVELHPQHRKLYQKYLQRERQKVLGLLDDVNKNRFTILRSLTLLRQLSLHAGLVDEAHGGYPCAKIDVLMQQLGEVVDGGHRALVFSQFTGFLSIARERLEASGIEYCYLDGSTRNREEVIARFKEGRAPVFLISLKAGGFGLNLTEADYCFLLDPWWNPATEAQAVDRTHRIGQTRNVMVYRLIAADTIEEKVMALKARKAKLFTSVMDDGNAFGSSLDVDDIRGLFE
ncbi:DEAD/DEAH box helicase [Phytoactinopolyspora halotolerans]|uniref:DEAD/DEAH box helicase n=1 Tax=Phytoactinopolyspora halotolerans TaxID=1981512 RepID=A0A6L9SCD9_9ACTN|nr:SNF2-related protein [Phytoactinopolyspora halotolerans]NEE03045.1 DEAD/DEAH box helicase [Phytoactinopolyspora halotolerans]